MKHNPKLHERVAALPGHARLHPLQDAGKAQGHSELMWRLQGAPAEVAGFCARLAPAECRPTRELAGLLLTRAYHEDRGEQRTKVLTPDTAHGTNPATVTMAGYEVVKVGTAPTAASTSTTCARRRTRTSPASCSRTRTRSGSSTPTSRRSPASCTASERRSTTTGPTSTP